MLTAKQKRFIDEYLIDLNATAAAQRAGYKNPNKIGTRLVGKSSISEEISKRMADRSKRTEITQDRVLRELAAIAFQNSKNLFEWDSSGVRLKASKDLTDDEAAAVSDVSEIRSKEGITVKVRVFDKMRALELLAKHLGMLTDKIQTENVGTIEFSWKNEK